MKDKPSQRPSRPKRRSRTTSDLPSARLGLAPNTTLRDLLRVLFRFKRRSALFFAATLAVVVVGLIVSPRKYTSEAKLLVRVGRSSVTLDPTVTTGEVIGLDASREAEINSVLEVIKSRSILEQVVDRVGTGAPYASAQEREKAIVKLRKSLSIWTPKKSTVIVVSHEASSPELAQKTVSTLVDVFLHEHLRVNSTPGSYQFFEEQSALTQKQLDEATENLRKAKNEFHLASIQGRRETLQKQIGEVETQTIALETALEASRAKIAALQGGLEHLPSAVVRQFVKGLPDEAAGNMRQQLYQLQSREQELLSKYTESHPEVVAIQQQVRKVENILQAEQPNRGQATSAVLLTEQANQKSLLAQRQSLADQYQRLQEKLNALNGQEVRIVDLERKVRLLDAKFQKYTENLEQARIDKELQLDSITNISVIQPASRVLKPTSPRKGITLGLALMAATFGSIGLAFLCHRLDSTLSSPADIEQHLAVPVLVSIPGLPSDTEPLQEER